VSSSGLICAVIVGAWAAYLVPMWLRRQDELNEARPTERFTTAIRLLAGRSGLERRAKSLTTEANSGSDTESKPGSKAESNPDAEAAPKPARRPSRSSASGPSAASARGVPGRPATNSRTQLLARRRRVVSLLFLAFLLGAIAAGLGGLPLLWAPLIPGALLSAYIIHLRRREVSRYRSRMRRGVRTGSGTARSRGAERVRDRAGAHPSGQRHREAGRESGRPRPAEAGGADSAGAPPEPAADAPSGIPAVAGPAPAEVPQPATPDEDGGWAPVPLPLPTYVTAPVAPRTTDRLDLTAPDTFSAGRAPAGAERADRPAADPPPRPQQAPQSAPQRARRRPSAYQNPYSYQADEDRPRAANE
jgi:type II secretory pathway pseudopilin PulG